MKSPMRSELVTRDLEFLDLLLSAGRNCEICEVFGKKFVVEKVAKDRSGGVAVLVEVNVVEDREESWTGAGLPPVGIECESLWNSKSRDYLRVKVLAHDGDVAIIRWLDGDRIFELQGRAQEEHEGVPVFRPLRTPEQIAAEEREKAVEQMVKKLDALRLGDPRELEIYSEVLYDAGYRLQEPKE